MDFQAILNNALAARRAEAMKTSQQLTLGELILKLEAIENKEKPVVFDDHRYHPTDVASWRGSYDELAIAYAEEDGSRLSTRQFLQRLKSAIGPTFGGYKGGEYVMGKTTPVWVANFGESSGFREEEEGNIDTQAVVDVAQDETNVIIETRNIEY